MGAVHGLASAFLGAGLGVQIFLSYLVAPTAFRLVERAAAIRLMEAVFPGYYAFGLATTAAALGLAAVLAARAGGTLRWGATWLLGLTLAGTVYAGHVLLLQAHAARLRAQAAPAGDLAPLEFSRLHRRAVGVNIALFAAGAMALALHLAAGAPGPAAHRRPASAARAGSQPAGGNLPSRWTS
jgi:hypothetical protein